MPQKVIEWSKVTEAVTNQILNLSKILELRLFFNPYASPILVTAFITWTLTLFLEVHTLECI